MGLSPFLAIAVSILLVCRPCLATGPIYGEARASTAGSARTASAVAGRDDTSYEETKDKGYRFERGGWIYLHLEGTPYDIGYQHGYLLAPEIGDAFATVRLEMTHNTGRDWDFFRRAARTMLWHKIDNEYQFELKGIVDGLHAKGANLDLDDIVAFNAFSELPDYYVPWLNAQTRAANSTPNFQAYAHCSAFIATGSWTKDHQIVMAHSNWTTYAEGVRWRIIFDIVPRTGYRILMDGFPGAIASDDDFGVNSSGLMITETTIANFHGWDPEGKAEFVRARKAMQYADSIDGFVRIMQDGNNGGYANDWLIGDRKTNEIAQLELGLKAYKLWRTKDGVFAGSNWARDPKVLKLDTPQFNPNDSETSPNARRARWEQLLDENKGKLDVELAEKLLGDHFDTFDKKEAANERTLCGHVDISPRGVAIWAWGPSYPGGAVQGKASDSTMAQQLRFFARMGHPCGGDFDAKPFLAAHPDYAWQEPYLRDMPAGPWTEFHAGEIPAPQR